MNLTNTMFYWTPGGGVELGPWPDPRPRSQIPHPCSGGACYRDVREGDDLRRQLYLASEAIVMAERDGVDPRAISKAFEPLEEWAAMSRDWDLARIAVAALIAMPLMLWAGWLLWG